MADIKSKIKEPFETMLDRQLAELESAAREIESIRDIPKDWDAPKGNIRHCVLPQFGRWAEARKRVAKPVGNLKVFNRERRRLLWFRRWIRIRLMFKRLFRFKKG
jgi:hypothetical protein